MIGKRTGLCSLMIALAMMLCLPMLSGWFPDLLPAALSEAEEMWEYVETVEPTCNGEGYKLWYNPVYGQYEERDRVPALGHDYRETITREPTCTEEGYAVEICTRCGGGKDNGHAIPALGHSWTEWSVVNPATCTEEGLQVRNCTRCGIRETQPIPAKGHSPVVIPGVPATCTTGGKTEGSQCSVCGATLVAQADTPALGHSPVAVAGKAATCTEAGLTEGSTCSRCGAVINAQQAIPALGHSEAIVSGYEATCTEAGLTDGSTCSRCGTVITTQQTIPALGHAWDNGTITANPTCTENGEIVYFCNRCWETLSETLPATGHTPVATSAVEATCTTGGRTSGTQCSVCGAVLAGPQDTPALGHAWNEGTITQYPGCTYEGVKTYTCTRCGATTTETVAATGHWWDEGVVTKEAGYLEEGEITYTCQRDASHKRTEAIPVKEPPGEQSVMSLLRSGGGGITTMKNPVPLFIETQPVGGALSGETGTYELSIGVMGGDQPYTYEWHRISDRIAQQVSSIIGALGDLTASINEKYEMASALATRMGEKINGWKLTEPKKETVAQEGTFLPLQADSGSFVNSVMDNVFSVIVGDDSPTYTATAAGTYYCVVRDDNKDEVTSVKVEVGEKLHIVQQPQNANIYGKESVQLTCEAAGGSGPEHYLYNWFDASGNLLSDERTLTISQEGNYYCQVWDFGADGMVESEPATVYSANPLWIEVAQDDYYIVPGEDSVIIEMQFGGGVAPLTGKWMNLYGETLATFTSDNTQDQAAAYTATELGTYFLYVTDAMGVTRADLANVEYRQLEIAQQPEGGMLSADGETPVKIDIVMAEGEEPFNYYLYKNGEFYIQSNGVASCSFRAWDSGEYYIHIEDANGRWADSNTAIVTDYKFQIDHIDVAGPITDSSGTTLTAVVNGGEEPIIYGWWYIADDGHGEQLTRGYDSTWTVFRPGIYLCYAEDATKAFDRKEVQVEYIGTAPIIIHQPENVMLDYDGEKVYSAPFCCEAIAWDGATDCLEYKWYYKRSDGWKYNGGADGTSMRGYTYGHDGDGRIYRCIVTDTRTGEQTMSNEAFMNTKMSCYIDEYTRISYWTISPKGGPLVNVLSQVEMMLHFHVEGGTAPYWADVYQHRIEDNDVKDAIVASASYLMEDNMSERPVYITYSYVSVEDSCLRTEGAHYFVKITDALGQICESDIR